MARTFLISDTHISHKNIIQYESRPFTDLYHMEQTIIKNWNNIVSKEDKVFHLGDVCFGNKESVRNFISQLNGKKYLIMGNHDKSHSVKWWLEAGFDWVSRYSIIYKYFYILSHEPIYINSCMPYINCHGHIHSNRFDSKQFVNCSVECIDYTPIDFEEIKNSCEKIIESKKVKE